MTREVPPIEVQVAVPPVEAEVEAPPPEAPIEPPALAEVRLAPPARALPAPRPVEATREPVAEPPAPAAPENPDVLAPPSPPPLTEATFDREVEANFPACDAATELRSATRARALLSANQPEEAVWLLSAYQRRCASGRWSDEAWAVRMAGLCRLGRKAEVIGLLEWFSTEYPARRAAVLADLRSSCPDEVLNPRRSGAGGEREPEDPE